MSNPVLDAVKNRRTAYRFEDKEPEKSELDAILEAGRWAPSWLNKQPWKFIVVKSQETKKKLTEAVPTVFVQGLQEAPICIVIVTDPKEDPYHFVEDAAVAAQNMALVAHSVGLYSSWIGVLDSKGQKNSGEDKVKRILNIPKELRVIALLPIGHAKSEPSTKERKPIGELIFYEQFGKR